MANKRQTEELGIEKNAPLDGEKMARILSPDKEEIRKEGLGFKPADVVKLNKKMHDDKVKVSRRDRIEVQIVKDTRYLKKGEFHSPSIALGKTWIESGIAKKVDKE